MARIIKIRVIPRGYVKVEEEYLDGKIRDIMKGYTPEGMFMRLFKMFGNPQDGGQWSYMLRHNNVVIRITCDKTMRCDVWLSPGHIQEAKRKRTKAVNVIARRLNEADIVFLSDETIYYAVRKKNDLLKERQGHTDEEYRNMMDAYMTDEEKAILYGGISRFTSGVVEEIGNIMNIVYEGC